MHASEMVEVSKPPPALAAMPTSSTEEHSAGELDRLQQPPLAAAAAVVKRKRTKRPRHHHPAAAASASSASSSESTTTEEEDMAHCLILLAQGAGAAAGGHHAAVDSKPSPSPAPHQPQPTPAAAIAAPMPAVRSERYTSRKYTEAAATADGVRAGFYVYECKTCNKCFPTFQALGGHRASHKKPRLAAADDEIASNVITAAAAANVIKQQKPPAPIASPVPATLLRPHHQIADAAVFPDVTTALSLNSGGVAMSGAAMSTAKLRVHECSICGAEFASGQALGGHMRRHRPLNAPVAAAGTTKKEAGSACINLELDLNLPAPSEEEAAVSLPAAAAAPPAVVLGLGQFSDGNKAGLVLTASALVDCHY
ncbi:unnamed protein product [Urochloa decumbens]|uniref:C2H2-type domain-containing protein n=1 Tax=Urochloa decumbens TaxID=240449 RepID=A0ABC9A0N5_9POAL